EIVKVGDLEFKKKGTYAVVFGCDEDAVSVKIPAKVDGLPVTSIGGYAFEYCTLLTNITIPDSVTSIGNHAFDSCSDLTGVTLGKSVKSIGDGAFFGCGNLTSITIPDSVTSIGDGAFDDCGLKSITIPDSVTSIGNGAFEWCSELTSITIPDSVTSIGERAFGGCSSLTIYSYAGTYAEQYANKNNIPFSAIELKQISKVTLSRAVFQYTGNPVKVGSYITVYDGSTKLKYGKDFTLSYSNNVNCGKNTAKVTVKGIGKYAGYSVTKTYSIAPALSTKNGKLHIEWNKVSGAAGYQVQYCKNSSFTGDTLHSTSVTNGKLYCDLVTYPKSGESWCVRVRSFTLTSTGGRKYAAWSGISVLKLNKISDVELKYTAFHYKGKEIKVGKYLKVYSGNQKLVYEKDFVLEYKNNVDRGTATVTVKGIGEYAGSSVSKTYKIV
ncbi:MAG: leucine-rich repeat domain-containing protein, partial [Oscillospiraceae bacterium]|nr:leucine-rich repeat domain-containing protein [Oscillospiraceae bacterium]